MSSAVPLQRFDAALESYLSSRRALGRRSRLDEYVLRRLRRYLARTGHSDLNATNFAAWRRHLRHCVHNTQVDWAMMTYRFCRYRRRRENRCFLPQRWALGRHHPYRLPTPIGPDQVRRLLDYISGLKPEPGRPLSSAARRLAVVLMYTAGLRRGEVARLQVQDADAENGVLRIQESKFHKSRWVPLSPTATREMRRYLRLRAAIVPRAAHNTMLLCSRVGHGYSDAGLSSAVRLVMHRSGI